MLGFIGIGAQKSGTTWLYEWLRAHPDLSFPSQKELHFWNLRRSEGAAAYSAIFTGLKVEGEITPAYGILPVEVIREIHAGFPDIRLIYLVRNPMERAWSSAVMAMKRAELRFEDASDAWFLDHFKSMGSLARGDYETCIRNWRSVYGNNLLVIFYDDILSQPRRLLRQCYQHIGVSTAPAEAFEESSLRARVFEGGSGQIRRSLRRPLLKLYAEKIRSFGNYMGRDLSHWINNRGLAGP